MGRRGQPMMKGSQDPSDNHQCHKELPERGSGGIQRNLTDSILESGPFPAMVWDRKCSQSKDKWGELHGPSRQWCPGEYHHTEVCK